MTGSRQFQAFISLLPGDTGGQYPLPKMGSRAKNAESPMPVGVSAYFSGIGRSRISALDSAENQGFSVVRTAGDTGVHGKDFGKIFGNVSAPSVAIGRYGNIHYNAGYSGGARG